MAQTFHHHFSIDYLAASIDRKDSTIDLGLVKLSPSAGPYPIEDMQSPRHRSAASSPESSPSSSSQSPVSSIPKSSCKIDIAQTLLELEEKASGSVKCSKEAKPTHSYIALISQAILSSPDRKMLLGDIYRYISEKYPYYKLDQKAWRNSIRHNLSINECFVKAGKLQNKGNYWAIHPACVTDFAKGDYRRRQARRRARRCDSFLQSSYTPAPMAYNCPVGYVPMTSSPGYSFPQFQQLPMNAPTMTTAAPPQPHYDPSHANQRYIGSNTMAYGLTMGKTSDYQMSGRYLEMTTNNMDSFPGYSASHTTAANVPRHWGVHQLYA